VLVAASALAYRVATARSGALAVAPLAEPVTPSIGPLREPATPSPSPVAVASEDRPSNALARQAALHSFEEALAAADGAPVDSVVATAPPQGPETEALPPPRPSPAASVSLESVRIVMYTTSWCPVCTRAKAWMAGHGIPYEEHDIEASSDDARMNRAINPRGSIPTFDIEGDVMVGFSEGQLVATMQRAAQRRALRPY
jgi:glutaredoxin